jgi:Holliday junction DNA helicase RuvA
MIGRLVGTLVRKQPPELLLDVDGVGYELEAPMTAFYDLPALGQEVTLFTHLVVRDDAHLLFGFSERRQRDLFRALLKVSGVGPRVGLAILSGLTAENLVSCITVGDVGQLTRIPGIGRKTAERLIVDLRDRLESSVDGESSVPGGTANPEQDAISGLVALGYRSGDAARAVRESDTHGGSVEEIIRGALQKLAGGHG